VTKLPQIAKQIRSIALQLLKDNRNEERHETIVAQLQASIELTEAANRIDKAINHLVPFDLEDTKVSTVARTAEPQNRSPRGKVTSTEQIPASDWGTLKT